MSNLSKGEMPRGWLTRKEVYMKTKIIAIILVLTLTLSLVLSGCSESNIRNLSDDYSQKCIIETSNISENTKYYSDFAARLLKETFDGKESALVSPLSVMLALAMTAEGADAETLTEIEELFGMSAADLRSFAYSYMYPKVNDTQLSTANSLWINDSKNIKVNDEFMQNNAEFHKAEVFEAEFNGKTVEEINNWVKENTDGMIDKVIDSLDKRAVMCLVNALLFDAKWEELYNKHQVQEGEFVTENGTAQKAEFLHSTEQSYLEDEKATGFVKYYEGRDYAFVALLPKEGVSMAEYVKYLSGEKIDALLENAEDAVVYAKMPKFEHETDLSLKPALENMGMVKAFDMEKADFSKLGKLKNGNIWIGDVLHSTKISVTENGTKAGAATAEVLYGSGAILKEVFLNRPFVYMIVDAQNNVPVFMGTMMGV